MFRTLSLSRTANHGGLLGTILDLTTGGQPLNLEVKRLTENPATTIGGHTATTIVKLPHRGVHRPQ